MDMDLENQEDDDDNVLGIYGLDVTTISKVKKETSLLNKGSFKSPQVDVCPTTYSPATQTPSEKYGSRAKSGDVIFRYKCKDSSFWEPDDNKAVWEVVKVTPTSDFLKNNDYKYMFQKIKEVAMALNELMEDTSRDIFEELDTDDRRASLKDASVDESLYLGRIRSDGKLTAGSVYFEGCLDYSDGHIVELDLSAVDEYHIFPGQIVVLEGTNELRKCLRVSKIHVPKLLPFSEIEITPEQDPSKLNIVIAVGPHTPSDSLLYEPLKDLLKIVARDKPDICILIGPFIEATHRMIEGGEVPDGDTFDGLFQKLIDELIKTAGDLHTRFLLVPSFKDVHGHDVYPTPAYPQTRSDKVVVLPDPASISIGGVVISMTSTDILKHLSKNELANSMISTDRMGRLARHILSQRNFYPLYPCDETVPVDIEHSIKYAKIERNPHILIVPSDIRYFIKEVDGTIIVNPERLTKTSSGGTYARLQVDLSSASIGEKYLSIADFCVGEIVKI